MDELLRPAAGARAGGPAAADKIVPGHAALARAVPGDIGHWGYRDARLEPGIQMTPADIAHWTRAIDATRRTT